MQTNVNVLIKEDNSVQEKIRKTAVALDKKYSKKRKVNEKRLLKGQSKVARVFSVIIDAVLISLCVICCLFGLTSFIFKLNNLPPSFAGYSYMQVVSGSMVDAGFDIGDTIVVQKVNTKTLNVGDHIAFYVYTKDYEEFYLLQTENISETKESTKHSYNLSFSAFFGVPTSEIAEAGKANARLVFHTITDIYEDENGMYWYQTKGASNATEDYWKVSERMVIGVYNESAGAKLMSGLLQVLSSNNVILIIIAIPLILMSISFVFKMIKRVQLTKLELDCIEEKRKITDEICVKNDIGFNMSTRDKYKILVQAPEENREEYLALLWKDGSAPNSIRKYVIRKKFRLKENEQRLELHRACEKMREEGKDGEEIAKFYLEETEKIEQQQLRYKKIFKNMRKKTQENKVKAEKEAKMLAKAKVDEIKPEVVSVVETKSEADEVPAVVNEPAPKTEKVSSEKDQSSKKSASAKETTDEKATIENEPSKVKSSTKATTKTAENKSKPVKTGAKNTSKTPAKKSASKPTEKKTTTKPATAKKSTAKTTKSVAKKGTTKTTKSSTSAKPKTTKANSTAKSKTTKSSATAKSKTTEVKAEENN